MSGASANALAGAWLARLDEALRTGAIDAAAALFGDECYWRDLLAFTWNIRTFEGRAEVAAMLRATLAGTRPSHWRLRGEATGETGTVEAWFTFETALARGQGHLRLRDGRCWTLLTTMTELVGFEERRGPTRPRGVEHGVVRGRRSWLEERQAEQAELGFTRQPYVVIVGGGQGGLGLGARLRRLGVPTIVIEKHPRAGDSWRQRYRSLCLHDPVWYDHMPYLPYPDDWPVFTPKDKMGDWLEMYAKVMELNYWGSTECIGARYDEAAGRWRVEVERDGRRIVLQPAHLVLATGMSGMPQVPAFEGSAAFRGKQQHSSAYGSGEAWTGRRCVVIGSNNSAHDICADLWENGAEVTMVQRSSTLVVRSDTLMELAWGRLYSEEALAAGITTDLADMTLATMPHRLMPAAQRPLYERIARRDAEFYDRLRRVGFMLDFGEDGSGLAVKYARRGSGYYIDVGASDLVADGRVALRSGVQVRGLREHSVVLSDGSELPADLVVYATGFQSMHTWAAKIVSEEVASRVGPCWGLGSGTARDPGPWEGELRNMWKPTAQAGLWFHGGNLQQSRFFSKFVALQLKARMEGLPTPVHGGPARLDQA